MENPGSKHTFSIHTPFCAQADAGARPLCKADRAAAPAAEAGDAGLTGDTRVGCHQRDVASSGHGARDNLTPRGGAKCEAPTADSTAGAADACGKRGDTEG